MAERGYCGIGVINLKRDINYGTLFRSALCFDADFLFLVGRRFEKMSSDTMRTERHIPLYEYESVDSFLKQGIPYNCQPVCVEISKRAKNLITFTHPERAIYILGAEDGSVPEIIQNHCVVVDIPTSHCLNVAVAGSIVLYDRLVKRG